MTGAQIWDLNLGAKGKKAPEAGIKNQDTYDRCKGIVSTLFVPREGDVKYKFDYGKVTPVISIGIGMDLMMNLLTQYDYPKALEQYNQGKEPAGYRKDILDRAEKENFEGD